MAMTNEQIDKLYETEMAKIVARFVNPITKEITDKAGYDMAVKALEKKIDNNAEKNNPHRDELWYQKVKAAENYHTGK